ncbi:hypothetical protein nbrc107696_46000 [Gordonia spumicola]|uniref:Uncharacterized protein n=1 Tax=Gordonia spumicola TaxID=589161 RepID=A0A7I9V463_9ACTN|nr:hypothetical protein nbrc107696_06710 [Gordonia spumicola]GEE04154.1 hypothetical protein nbrc107696_46000 [Gordonia spumicola]
MEGARIGRRRMSVHYALAQVRTMPIVDAHVNQMKGVASIAGIDPVTQTVRTIAILHQPTIRIPDGVDAEGRAAFTHRPCEEAAS